MMTRQQFLLLKLAEECAEVAQRCSKAMQFGMDDIDPNHNETARQRLQHEIVDVMALIVMLQDENILPRQKQLDIDLAIAAKIARVEHYFKYSVRLGTVKG